jgi:site-specific DNA recombinase
VGVAAAGRGRRYRYYACFTRQRYGKDACSGERIRADVLDALVTFYADPNLIKRAVAVKTEQVAATTRQHHDEIDAVTAELKKTEAAIERYILAFEAGTISDDMFGPRVRDLGDRARTLKARRESLKKPPTSPPWTHPRKPTSTTYVPSWKTSSCTDPTPDARQPPEPSSIASSSSPASSSPPTSSKADSPPTIPTRIPSNPLLGRRLAP